MAYFSEINENNIVIRLVKTDTNDPNGDEGYQWLIDNLGGKWIKTSYNTRGNKHILGGTPFRKNLGQPEFFYDEKRDAFIPPQPYPDWILNEETCLWEEPN